MVTWVEMKPGAGQAKHRRMPEQVYVIVQAPDGCGSREKSAMFGAAT